MLARLGFRAKGKDDDVIIRVIISHRSQPRDIACGRTVNAEEDDDDLFETGVCGGLLLLRELNDIGELTYVLLVIAPLQCGGELKSETGFVFEHGEPLGVMFCTENCPVKEC